MPGLAWFSKVPEGLLPVLVGGEDALRSMHQCLSAAVGEADVEAA
jgi:hypothetical protein